MTEYIGTETEKTFTIIDNNLKSSNPKDLVGINKVPFSTVPTQVMAEVGVAMLEGALKYARHNYRTVGVRSSVYYDACLRHMAQWWEGDDVDQESGLSHVTKAIASMVVLRDSMLMGNLSDDRPPRHPNGSDDSSNGSWIRSLNDKVKELIKKYPNPKGAHTQLDHRTTGNGIE